MTVWTDFVSKVLEEGRETDPDYSFKQALQDASKRKSEMGSVSSNNTAMGTKKTKKGIKKSKKAPKKSNKGSKKSNKGSKKARKGSKKGGTRKHKKH
jgi:hypothetical protein